MKTSSICGVLLTFILIWGTSNALGDDFRCGSNSISVGARKTEILRKCGDPSNIEVWQEVYFLSNRGYNPIVSVDDSYRPTVKVYIPIEEWEYNLGSAKFIRYLRFENARLTRITTGDYGY